MHSHSDQNSIFLEIDCKIAQEKTHRLGPLMPSNGGLGCIFCLIRSFLPGNRLTSLVRVSCDRRVRFFGNISVNLPRRLGAIKLQTGMERRENLPSRQHRARPRALHNMRRLSAIGNKTHQCYCILLVQNNQGQGFPCPWLLTSGPTLLVRYPLIGGWTTEFVMLVRGRQKYLLCPKL
jgi:hypothetical protein